MNIGIFDSGLGGLMVTEAIRAALPQYHYVYLGDTKRVPYGNRSQAAIYEFTEQAVAALFARDCSLVIIACNTASAEALRRIQQAYLPTHAPDRRVLGVIIPAAEEAADANRVGVLATSSTVHSQAFTREIHKLNPTCEITQVAAPLLVPMIENDGLRYLQPVLADYLSNLHSVERLILGCTHYSVLSSQIREILPGVQVISQDEVIPAKLADYLQRHPEIEQALQRDGQAEYLLTDAGTDYASMVHRLVGKSLDFQIIDL